MPFYIAGAILLSSAYTANEARKSRKEAEDQTSAPCCLSRPLTKRPCDLS
jgi:hypothetical protein